MRRIYSLEWFEQIEDLRVKVDELRNQVESAYAAAGPHGQQIGSIGGGGGKHDALAAVDALVDSDVSAKLASLQAELRQELERATDVLYGKSGKGGLAMHRGSTDADILCCHYLQGMGWAEIAKQFECNDGHWCRMRAMRTLTWLDRHDMDELAAS